MDKGVWKAAPEKLIVYNQDICSPWACTYVAGCTAISNKLNKELTDAQLVEGWRSLVNDGKFTANFGASLIDGSTYALKQCNKVFGKNLKQVTGALTPEFIITAIRDNGSPVHTGLKVGANFLNDEQDNGIIDELNPGTVLQHSVAIIKINTYDDVLIKYLESYEGKVKFDVILADFIAKRPMFFNSGIYYAG